MMVGCQPVTTGLLLAFIIGSLLFTGGQVTRWAQLDRNLAIQSALV